VVAAFAFEMDAAVDEIGKPNPAWAGMMNFVNFHMATAYAHYEVDHSVEDVRDHLAQAAVGLMALADEYGELLPKGGAQWR
jgi:hypothetical protein